MGKTFHNACKSGDVAAVEAHLNAVGANDIDAPDDNGISGLAYAIGANRIAIVKILLDKGADHRSCDWNENSGTHFAAAYGRKELLEFLLANGGSKTKMNSDGQTPLDLATEQKGKLHSTFAVTQHCSW